MGKAPQRPALPRDKPKSGAPTLKRFCPAGANSVDPAHRQHILAPRGKDASFPPPFPSALEADANAHLHAGSPFPAQPRRRKRQKRRKSLPSREEENPEALLSPPSPPTSTAALRARADADIRRPCGAYPCREAAPLRRAAHRPGRPRLLLLDENPGAGRYLQKARASENRKLCRENAATRRTKPRRAMPSAAGNAVRPCRSRRFFRAGASYSLAAVL